MHSIYPNIVLWKYIFHLIFFSIVFHWMNKIVHQQKLFSMWKYQHPNKGLSTNDFSSFFSKMYNKILKIIEFMSDAFHLLRERSIEVSKRDTTLLHCCGVDRLFFISLFIIHSFIIWLHCYLVKSTILSSWLSPIVSLKFQLKGKGMSRDIKIKAKRVRLWKIYKLLRITFKMKHLK